MFSKKKTTYINLYDKQWNNIINLRRAAINRMEELYVKIQDSIKVKLCFEENSPNWKTEDKYLKDLRYQMLCVCGEFDDISCKLKELWKNHKDDLQAEFCFDYEDLDIITISDCNAYLRSIVETD